MRISRHDKIDMFVGEIEERRLQFLQLRRRLLDLPFDIKSQIERHLIIATARGVQLPASFADSFGERALNIHVHVLERFVPLEFSGIDFLSNFAQPGFESRHNLKYWRREPYLGFGADAHSFDGESRWQNAESASDYVAQGHALQAKTAADPVSERLFLGLRLAEGIAEPWEPFADSIRQFIHDGLLEQSGSRVRLTPRGVMLSNEVFQQFIGAPV